MINFVIVVISCVKIREVSLTIITIGLFVMDVIVILGYCCLYWVGVIVIVRFAVIVIVIAIAIDVRVTSRYC